jgi:hypothetical protein
MRGEDYGMVGLTEKGMSEVEHLDRKTKEKDS